MLRTLRKQLELAQGRSEFVIVVVCDIRGFSAFSTMHESPDTAMFIKRFYLQLINAYFSEAAYVKPTGDGLLMIFRYSEKTVHSVAEYVLGSCFSAIQDFPNMFVSDPMINFSTPNRIGFGISRGPACCLYSGRSILDYSGQLLNLASRLNDLARPIGVVVDGGFLMDVIPESLRNAFTTQQVYVRGISEDTPRPVFCSTGVELPSYSLFPIAIDSWKSLEKKFTLKDLLKYGNTKYNFDLPAEVQSPNKIKVELIWPNPKIKGSQIWRTVEPAEYYVDARGPHVRFAMSDAAKLIKGISLKQSAVLTFRIQYVPRPNATLKKLGATLEVAPEPGATSKATQA